MRPPARSGDHDRSQNFAPLLQAIEQHALPGATGSGRANIVVARPTYGEIKHTEAALAPTVTITPRKMLGPRQSVRAYLHNRSYHHIARWTKDGLLEASIPHLICVVGGLVHLCLGKYVLHCKTGVFILIPPGIPYPERSLQLEANAYSGSCDLLWFCGGSLASGLQCWLTHSNASRNWILDPGPASFLPDSRLSQYFHAFFDEAITSADELEDNHSELIQSLLVATLRAAHREIKSNRCFYPGRHSLKANLGSLRSAPIEHAVTYMTSHLAKSLTIETVAHAVYLSRSQFFRRFQQETGKTFTQFLTELRLAEARRLLQDTEWSVQTICKMVGLASTAHLRSLFSTHEGLSPIEFRRRSRAEAVENNRSQK